MMRTYIKKGNEDVSGFTWHYVYEDGEPVMENGVHVAYNSKNAVHAKATDEQLIEIRKAIKKNDQLKISSGVLFDADGNEYEPNGEGQYVIRFADLIDSGEFTPKGEWKMIVEETEVEEFLIIPTKDLVLSENLTIFTIH